MTIIRHCLNCGAEFKARPFKVREGKGNFCSHACNASFNHRGKPKPKSIRNIAKAAAARRGMAPWNKKPKITVLCQQCDGPFSVVSYRQTTAKFCNRHCHNLFKKTIRGQNHPLFKRILKSCEWCGEKVWVKPAKLDEFRFCCRQCQGASLSSHYHIATVAEKRVAQMLKGLSIPFKSEYRIGKYSCDFVLLQHHIVIEVDGDYWHSLPKQKAFDIRKDKILHEQGWTVIRLRESDIYTKANLAQVALCIGT